MKLQQLSGKEISKILCRNGFVVVRQKGSHVRLEKNTKEGTMKLTVPCCLEERDIAPNYKGFRLERRNIYIE